jgi:hypothetical protein
MSDWYNYNSDTDFPFTWRAPVLFAAWMTLVLASMFIRLYTGNLYDCRWSAPVRRKYLVYTVDAMGLTAFLAVLWCLH